MHTVSLLQNLKERDHFEDLGVDKNIVLEWTLRSRVGGCGLYLSVSRRGPVAGPYEHGDEPSGFIKGGGFLDYLNDH
jgi:hypothetical protein